uniref:60S acidic ribosomal protein P0 n=1 Tax=Babesia bovis TaxID=5865 RepID=Q8T5Q5_BABBO|nr:putative phosphoriboprotein P0 [Babesia bovis]ACM43997.1 ribosomal phosphoprotein [Babesia bovis]ACM43998.1 ribosomal phosphoprotein [Babesia bovis]ACM43999.1 ribosomal phosphoprotein [Babesia bovis]ACM44000.1 ribosomal phosphoprotein [Babesia bovis]
MARMSKQEKKKAYFERLTHLVKTYPQILIVSVDYVGSRQMAHVRHSLRGKAEILIGKNTMIRMVLNTSFPNSEAISKLLSCVKLNVGFVFCMGDPLEVRRIILDNKVPAPAKQGVIAPCDVFISAGATGMDPSQTSFFQALGISTKIVKGQIEIQNDVHLIKVNDRVTASSATLLQKLNMKPFAYGLKIEKFYDSGHLVEASALDITEDDILDSVKTAVTNVNAFALAIGFPTSLSITHSLIGAFKNCVALALENDYCFKEMQGIKDRLDNPELFAAAAPTAGAVEAVQEAAPEAAEEPEEEEDDMGFSLFD